MQKCNKCEKYKKFEDYRKRGDGSHHRICKICESNKDRIRKIGKRESLLKQNKEYRHKNKEILAEKRRKRLGHKKRSGVDREKLKENHRRNHKKYVERYPHKIKAHQIVRENVRIGRLKKSDVCQICQESKRVEAHHEDYSKPLEVVWLCRQCHVKLHRGSINEPVDAF